MVYDITLEMDILSSCIFFGESTNAKICVESLEKEDFHKPKHQKLFLLIKTAIDKRIDPDLIALENLTSDNDTIAALYKLETHRSFSDIKPFIRRLKWIAKARHLCEVTADMVNLFKEKIDDIENAFSEKEAEITKVLNLRVGGDQGHFAKDRLANFFENLEIRMNTEETPGAPTGISKFDEITGGLRPGENNVIAGRPGMGKTSLALTIVARMIIDGYSPAYFSLEMQETEFLNKLFSILSEMVKETTMHDEYRIVDYYWLRNPKVNRKRLQRISEIAPILYGSKLYYNCDPYQDMNEIKSICRQLKYSENGLDAAFIDNIGNLVKDKKNEYAELSSYSTESKRMAMELNISSVPLVHLSRDAERKGQPSLSHLKGTGSFEEDADIVLFPWRPYVINKDDHPPSEALLITGKARNAIVPNINMTFSTATTLFEYLNQENSDESPEF